MAAGGTAGSGSIAHALHAGIADIKYPIGGAASLGTSEDAIKVGHLSFVVACIPVLIAIIALHVQMNS